MNIVEKPFARSGFKTTSGNACKIAIYMPEPNRAETMCEWFQKPTDKDQLELSEYLKQFWNRLGRQVHLSHTDNIDGGVTKVKP